MQNAFNSINYIDFSVDKFYIQKKKKKHNIMVLLESSSFLSNSLIISCISSSVRLESILILILCKSSNLIFLIGDSAVKILNAYLR